MSKNWDRPLPSTRTPEQHRRLIQKPRANPPSSKAKKIKPRFGGFDSYRDYLASPIWKATKTRWMASEACQGLICHANGCSSMYGLDLHHKTYARLGREFTADLVLVCRSCHEKIHVLERRGYRLAEATKMVVEG